jgi:hypothetical protein
MILAIAFLVIMVFSTSSFRSRRTLNTAQLQATPPPRIFVQPAQSESARHFLNGKVTLLNLQEHGSLMMLNQQKGSVVAKSPSYLLKSSEPFKFNSTLLTVQKNGQIAVHATLKAEPKIIVFRA